MDPLTIFLALLTIVVIYWWFSRHDSRLPPCPCRPLPVVGHLMYLEKNFRPQFEKWRQQCGDIYSLYMGPSLVIVVNGYKAMKETFVENGSITSDRPPFIFDQINNLPNRGMAFTSGTVWKEQRAVTMNILRTLGVGRNILVERVSEIAASLNEDLASLKGEPTDINHIITTSVANVICSIVIGERFDHQNDDFLQLCQRMRDIMVGTNGTQIVNYFPSLLHLPFDMFNMKRFQKSADFIMNKFAAKYVKMKGIDEYNENVLNNYVSLYVNEMNKNVSTGQNTSLNVENLIRNVYDLFTAGMETTSTTLLWCVLYMVHYPDVQQKIYEEIERKVGTERPVNIYDRNQLTYLQATILEVQRLSSIAPLSLPHLCTQTFSMGGYIIPKGAHLILNLDSVLFHEKVWGDDPDTFRPERFLDGQGKIQCPEEFIPFSLGKRICPGEAMAKLEMFLFFSNMMRRFQFVAADPQSPPSLEALVGINASPVPYRVRVLDRKQEV